MIDEIAFQANLLALNAAVEAARTLYSLTRKYQGLSGETGYEVIVIDNRSSQPLSASEVKSFGPEFAYHYFDTDQCAHGTTSMEVNGNGICGNSWREV